MTALLRRTLLIGGALAALMLASDARAEARVPLQLQTQLVRRLGTFDRNFPGRAGASAHVLVVFKPGNAESKDFASAFAKSIDSVHEVGGLPATVEEVEYASAPALVARCRSKKIAAVYFSVGLEPEMGAVGAAFAGVDALTIGASATHAEKGAVVGFDLEEGRPKIVVNLARAKAQNVSFKAELLKLARIVE